MAQQTVSFLSPDKDTQEAAAHLLPTLLSLGDPPRSVMTVGGVCPTPWWWGEGEGAGSVFSVEAIAELKSRLLDFL